MPIATPPPPPAGLPVPLGALSPWQLSVREHPLLNAGRDDPLPQDAEVVVIGSGLCGALTAYSLLSAEGGPKKVVLVEAREACSGASGRNAGHCRPDAYRGFNSYASLHGPESALEILDSEATVLDLVAAFIEKHSIDCEFQLKPTLDVAMTEAFEEVAAAAFARVKDERGGKINVQVLTGQEGKDTSRIPTSLTSYTWPAASLNPAKLCLAIHSMSVSLGLQLYTHTPVFSVTPSSSSSWSVNTSRGSILTPKVVHATNAYASALLPSSVSPFISPVRAQAHQLSAPPAGSQVYAPLAHTYSIRYLATHFYSLIQRPDASLVLGTSRGWPGMSEATKKEIFGSWDDSTWSEEIAENAFGVLGEVLEGSGYEGGKESVQEKKGGFEYGWGGIIGMTPDSVPFIGPIPSKPGQFIGAGFNGHGMARIFLCAPGLAKLVMGGKFEETGMPRAFEITEERLERLRAVTEKGLVKKTEGLALN